MRLPKLKKPAVKQGYTPGQTEADSTFTRVVNDVVIHRRDRTPAEQSKVNVLTAFITVALASEDIDPIFLAVMGQAQELGYKLQADPYALLHKLNNAK